MIDSAIYEENGWYYMFVKSEGNPEKIILLRSAHAAGPYERVEAFDESMEAVESGLYEAPTAVKLEGWPVVPVPGLLRRSRRGTGVCPLCGGQPGGTDILCARTLPFDFPYGFKHGTILTISMEEYDRIKSHNWSDKGYV